MATLLFSLCGFIMMGVLLIKTAGCKHSLPVTWIAWIIAWCVRYFGFSLYVSNYLAGKYQGEVWFSTLFLLLNAANLCLGIVVIAFLYEGSLQKNLVTAMIAEVIYTFWDYIILLFFSLLLEGTFSIKMMNENKPVYLLISIITTVWIYFLLHYGGFLLERYARWNTKHPIMVNIFLMAYMILGMISNVRFAATRGDIGFVMFCVLMILGFSYLWYDYLYMERVEEKKRHADLIYREKSLRRHYKNVMEQAAKVNSYNQEVQGMIGQLVGRVIAMEKDPNAEGKGMELAARYLSILQKQYDELSVSKYCEDYQMDHMLSYYEERFRNMGIKAEFLFQNYYAPAGTVQRDIEEILRWMLDGIIEGIVSDSQRDRVDPLLKDIRPQRLMLHGGVTGEELILSCETHAVDSRNGGFKKPEVKRIRKLLKNMKADIGVDVYKDGFKIIVGIPV